GAPAHSRRGAPAMGAGSIPLRACRAPQQRILRPGRLGAAGSHRARGGPAGDGRIRARLPPGAGPAGVRRTAPPHALSGRRPADSPLAYLVRSEEHTYELQSRFDIVVRLMVEVNKKEQK